MTTVGKVRVSGAPLKGVRGVRPHPRIFDSGCGVPLLRMAILSEGAFLRKNQLLQANKKESVAKIKCRNSYFDAKKYLVNTS